MLVKDLIDRLKKLPDDAEVVISYVYPVDTGESVSCTEDIADIEFDSRIVDLMTKGYKDIHWQLNANWWDNTDKEN